MPITQPYISVKVALARMPGMAAILQQIPTLINNINTLKTAGINGDKLDAFVKSYKQNLLGAINLEISIAANEAIAYALASATESDQKNSLLTPIIAGTPVNPAAGDNEAELTATLLDAANTLVTLNQLLNNANTILS